MRRPGIEDTKKAHRGKKQTIGGKGYWAGTPRVQVDTKNTRDITEARETTDT